MPGAHEQSDQKRSATVTGYCDACGCKGEGSNLLGRWRIRTQSAGVAEAFFQSTNGAPANEASDPVETFQRTAFQLVK